MKPGQTVVLSIAALASIIFPGCREINYEEDAKPIGDRITEMPTGELMVGRNSRIYSFDDYIFIIDPESDGATIYPFEPKTYRPLSPFGKSGPGPDELTRGGQLAYSPQRHELYATDYGKNAIVTFNMDSLAAGKESDRP